MFIYCNSIDDNSNVYQLPEILKFCWKLSSFLLILFYSSMVLVHLVASHKRNIETYEDLSNAQVITTTAGNTTMEVIIRVNIIKLKFH